MNVMMLFINILNLLMYTYKISSPTLSESFENFKYKEELKKDSSVNEIYNNHEYVPKFVKFNDKNLLNDKFSDNKINLVTNLNVDGNICESDIAFSFVESSKSKFRFKSYTSRLFSFRSSK